MKRKFYFFIVTLFLVVPILVGQIYISSTDNPTVVPIAVEAVKPPHNPHLDDVVREFEMQLDMLNLISQTPGAAVAVVRDSTIIYMKSFGVREAGTRDSVNVHTVFRLASVSKCFASFLTGIMVEEGRLAWDDPVTRYLPEFSLHSPEETSKLQISNVLSHTTGLPFHAYTNLVEEGLPLPELLQKLKDVPLATRVGQTYSYQNVAYSLIGEAMHRATGKSYEAWMIEKVFGPLGMRDASMDYFSIMSNENVARPHMPRKGGWRKVAINNTYYNVSPAGGVNASIFDMAHWMKALLGSRPDVISQETVNTCFTPYIKAPSKNRNYGRSRDSWYGMGWRILHFPNDTLVYHGGFVNGYRSEVAVSQKDNLAICILANAPGDLPDNGIPIFFNILRRHRNAIRQWDQYQVNTAGVRRNTVQ